jgi:hypothetical protein
LSRSTTKDSSVRRARWMRPAARGAATQKITSPWAVSGTRRAR